MTKTVMTRRKAKLAAPRQNCVKIPYGPVGSNLFWNIKVRNATKDVKLTGKAMHALKGTSGTTIGCHISNCATDAENKKAFPHDVVLASVTKTRAVIITKFTKNRANGIDGFGVLYHHDHGELVDLNDEDSAKDFAKTYPDFFERTLRLRAPRLRPVCKTGGDSDTPKSARGERSHSPMVVTRGALRRAEKAGLITKPIAEALAAAAA